MTEKEQKEVQEEIKTEMVQEEASETVKEEGSPEIDQASVDELIKKKKLEEKDREIVMYKLASDFANLRVFRAECESYHNTVTEMGENGDRECVDGVRRNTDFYREKYFEYFWYAKTMEIELNRLMIERSVTVDELDAFMQKVMSPETKEEE